MGKTDKEEELEIEEAEFQLGLLETLKTVSSLNNKQDRKHVK